MCEYCEDGRLGGGEAMSNETCVTYGAVIDAWRAERETVGEVSPFQARKSAQKARLFCNYFGNDDIDHIKPSDITSAIAGLAANGAVRVGKHGLSQSTIRSAYTAGKQAMTWACCNGLATRNPFDGVKKPKARSPRGRYLDAKQAADLSLKAKTELSSQMERGRAPQASYALAVVIALATGMRRGEIFALKWDAVDFNGRRIRVFRAVKGDGSMGEPKSSSGTRNVAIGKELAQLLQEFSEWQGKAGIAAPSWDESARVLCKSDGLMPSLNSFEHWWTKFADDCGYKGLHFHELRHTHATLLIANGVDVKTVQTRLGHSTAEITMSVYAHAIPSHDCEAAASLDRALFGGSR